MSHRGIANEGEPDGIELISGPGTETPASNINLPSSVDPVSSRLKELEKPFPEVDEEEEATSLEDREEEPMTTDIEAEEEIEKEESEEKDQNRADWHCTRSRKWKAADDTKV